MKLSFTSKLLLSVVVLFPVFATALNGNTDKNAAACKNLKSKPMHLNYDWATFAAEGQTNIQNLWLPPAYTLEGKMLRALRYENIAQLVEQRYCLPEGVVLAMIMQESLGDDCQPNRSDNKRWGDGGFGICHIQGIVGEEYGLNTVCNQSCGEKESRFKCYKHARELGTAITYMDNCDTRKMARRDDRLHPVINLDAVGRILARKKGSIQEKVEHYRGGTLQQRADYWKRIREYRAALLSPVKRKKMEQEFNEKNRHIRINGESTRHPYEDWIDISQYHNIGFGLWEYAALGECSNCCKQ